MIGLPLPRVGLLQRAPDRHRRLDSEWDLATLARAPEWRAYTEHPFTTGMADGSLPAAAFRRYLGQHA